MCRVTGCLVDQLHDLDAAPTTKATRRGKAGDLCGGGWFAPDQRAPEVAHHLEQVATRRGEHGVGLPHGLLDEHVAAHQLYRFQMLADRVVVAPTCSWLSR